MRRLMLSLLVLATVSAFAIGAGGANAALPEIGRCVKVAPTLEGHKKTYAGKFTNAKCTSESAKGAGKYEWEAGAGESNSFESPGTLEPVTLETTGAKKIACSNSKTVGEYTSGTQEKLELSLYGCKEVSSGESCQSLRPEEKPPLPEEGTIIAKPLTGELGFIAKGSKPVVGWDYAPASEGKLLEFECGKTAGLGTKVSIEGSFIGQVRKPLDKMSEEYFLRYEQKAGHQAPEMFEGAAKDTLSATFLTSSLQSTTEQLGYEAAQEEQSTAEALEIKALP